MNGIVTPGYHVESQTTNPNHRLTIYWRFSRTQKTPELELENNKKSRLKRNLQVIRSTVQNYIAFLVPLFQVSTIYTSNLLVAQKCWQNRLMNLEFGPSLGSVFENSRYLTYIEFPIYPTPKKKTNLPWKGTPFLNRKLHLPSINMLGFHRGESPLSSLEFTMTSPQKTDRILSPCCLASFIPGKCVSKNAKRSWLSFERWRMGSFHDLEERS